MISIIIPIYNESETISTLCHDIIAVCASLNRDFEIICVNDGSTDDSVIILKDLVERDKRIKVIHFPINFGQTSAIMAGIDYSIGDIIIPIDADMQNDPNDIPALINKIEEGYDVVSGWRNNRQDSWDRVLPSHLANSIISSLSGVHLHDYGCTLKAYRSCTLKSVKLYGEMHRFIPIYASWSGAKVVEIPVNHHPRTTGKSNYGIMRTFKVILDLIVVIFLAKYSQKPMYVFGGFGIFSLLLSLFSFMLMLYFKFFAAKSFIETPMPIVTTLFFMLGAISLLVGLLAELLMRTYFESQGKTPYTIASKQNFGKH